VVPYFLDRIERTYDMHHHWTGQDLGDLTPTERFLQNVLLCFISDPVGVHLVDRIGSANICWEMDYPHNITTGPRCAGSTTTPFQHISREAATVGALRARAVGHDIAIRSMGRGSIETAALDIGEMSKLATGR
jgi:hypothetical protein